MSVVIHPSHSGEIYDLNYPRFCWHKHPATVTASSTSPGTDPAWVMDGETWNAWIGGSSTATLTLTFTTPMVPVGYVAIAAHNLDLSGSTVSVEFDTGSGFVSSGAPSISPSGDNAGRPILFLFNETLCDAVRISISGSSAPEIAVFQAGQVTEIPRKSLYTVTPIEESQEIVYRQSASVGGHVLSRDVRSRGVAFDVTVDNLSEAWRQEASEPTRWAAFREHMAQGSPFFVAPRPKTYPNDLAYAYVEQPARFDRVRPNSRVTGSITWSCKGYKRT